MTGRYDISLSFGAGCEVPIPAEFYSEALLDYNYRKFADMYPIQHWLSELTQGLPSN